MPDLRMGEQVLAAVAPESGIELDVSSTLAWCRQRLLDYKVPFRIEIRASLPRGNTGKILRRLLKEGHQLGG